MSFKKEIHKKPSKPQFEVSVERFLEKQPEAVIPPPTASVLPEDPTPVFSAPVAEAKKVEKVRPHFLIRSATGRDFWRIKRCFSANKTTQVFLDELTEADTKALVDTLECHLKIELVE